MAYVADDADDLGCPRLSEIKGQSVAQGFFIEKEVAGESLADDDDVRRALSVPVAKEAPLDERDAHRAKVVGARRPNVSQIIVAGSGGQRSSLQREIGIVVLPAER